jgi:hypothetical protein
MSSEAPSPALPINPRNFWFWFGGVWLGVGLPFLLLGAFFAWNELTLESRLARAGQRAQGMVLVKSWGDGSDSRHPNLRVQYRFTAAAGKTMRSEATVSEEAWEALRERAAVSVTYLPDSPRANRIDGRVVQWVMPVVFCGIGAVLTLLGGFIMLKAISNARFVRRLREQGFSVEAEVIEVTPTGYMLNRVRQWVVLYRYRDHSGIEHDGRSPTMQKEEAERWHPGDRVTVYFDPLKPGRSAWTAER